MKKNNFVKNLFADIVAFIIISFSLVSLSSCSGALNDIAKPNGPDAYNFSHKTVPNFIFNENLQSFLWDSLEDAVSYNIYTDTTYYSSNYSGKETFQIAKSGLAKNSWTPDFSTIKWRSVSTYSYTSSVTSTYTYRFYIVGVTKNGQESKPCSYITVTRKVSTPR